MPLTGTSEKLGKMSLFYTLEKVRGQVNYSEVILETEYGDMYFLEEEGIDICDDKTSLTSVDGDTIKMSPKNC